MKDCEGLSDRMPVVALGRAEWAAEDVLHLSGCPICQQEWQIVRGAARLGQAVEQKFEREAAANAVLQRLRSAANAERLRRRNWSVAGLAAAAAIVVAVWTGGIERTGDPVSRAGPLAAGPLAFPLPELENLQPAELDSVLQTMEDPNLLGSAVEDPDLRDLNSDELERVLYSWEG